MIYFHKRPVVPITSDWMRANMREVLDRLLIDGERFMISRRGTVVGGLVPEWEARALYDLATRPVSQRRLERAAAQLEEAEFAGAVDRARLSN